MQLGFQLAQVQSLKLALTPAIQQSIHILQLSNLELVELLQDKALENPVIEIEWDEGMHQFFTSTSKVHHVQNIDPIMNIETNVKAIDEYIVEQVRLEYNDISPFLLKAITFLAGNINETGYLSISLKEASLICFISLEIMEKALKMIQQVDPAGIGARNLKECLLIQIMRDPYAEPYAFDVVQHYLDELAQGDFAYIARGLKISSQQVHNVLSYIQEFDPKPGLHYTKHSDHQKMYIISDAIVERIDDKWTVRMNNQYVPKMLINKPYLEQMKACKDSTANKYLKEQVQFAESILYSIGQREQTLTKVIETIVKKQMRFMEQGVLSLVPLQLQDIADVLDLHISTVSRAVKNKYIQTPHGIFELKSFFSTGLATTEGEMVSSNHVMQRIKELVEQESCSKPLSDQTIADQLFEEGIRVARRTVVKYRQQMRIPPSSYRKIKNA